MTRVLVTGASGFVGQALIRTFAERGYALRAALRRAPPCQFSESVELFRHDDLAGAIDWQPALDGIDSVVHLAGIAHIGPGIAAEVYDAVNRLATARLARAAAAAGIRQFVFVSSIRAQSGPSADHILHEPETAAPTDAYGRSKLAAEQEIESAGAPFTILRPVLLYGPKAKGNLALLNRIAALRCPLPLKSFVNRRSLLGIDNFISAIDFVLSAPAARGETYIVADPGRAPRLCDIIATMRKARGRRAMMMPMPPVCIEIPLRMIGRADLWERFGGHLEADAGKLIAAGWQPAHDTAGGLAAMVRPIAARQPASA